MPWYRTGTVSVTLNSNAVIGTGTAFVANSRVGDAFLGPDGGWYEVTNIASDSAMSIAPNYRGATNAAGVYALTPVQGYTKDLADQARAMIQQWGATLAGLGSVSTEDIVPVVKGGTGATTEAAARTNLGLGSASTATIGVATGNVMAVGAGGWLGTGAYLSNLGGSYQSCILGGGEATPGGADVVLNLPWPGDPGWKAQLFMKVSENRLWYRSIKHDASGALVGDTPAVQIYHTGNTTRAADGTLKAI